MSITSSTGNNYLKNDNNNFQKKFKNAFILKIGEPVAGSPDLDSPLSITPALPGPGATSKKMEPSTPTASAASKKKLQVCPTPLSLNTDLEGALYIAS